MKSRQLNNTKIRKKIEPFIVYDYHFNQIGRTALAEKYKVSSGTIIRSINEGITKSAVRDLMGREARILSVYPEDIERAKIALAYFGVEFELAAKNSTLTETIESSINN